VKFQEKWQVFVKLIAVNFVVHFYPDTVCVYIHRGRIAENKAGC